MNGFLCRLNILIHYLTYPLNMKTKNKACKRKVGVFLPNVGEDQGLEIPEKVSVGLDGQGSKRCCYSTSGVDLGGGNAPVSTSQADVDEPSDVRLSDFSVAGVCDNADSGLRTVCQMPALDNLLGAFDLVGKLKHDAVANAPSLTPASGNVFPFKYRCK